MSLSRYGVLCLAAYVSIAGCLFFILFVAHFDGWTWRVLMEAAFMPYFLPVKVLHLTTLMRHPVLSSYPFGFLASAAIAYAGGWTVEEALVLVRKPQSGPAKPRATDPHRSPDRTQ